MRGLSHLRDHDPIGNGRDDRLELGGDRVVLHVTAGRMPLLKRHAVRCPLNNSQVGTLRYGQGDAVVGVLLKDALLDGRLHGKWFRRRPRLAAKNGCGGGKAAPCVRGRVKIEKRSSTFGHLREARRTLITH